MVVLYPLQKSIHLHHFFRLMALQDLQESKRFLARSVKERKTKRHLAFEWCIKQSQENQEYNYIYICTNYPTCCQCKEPVELNRSFLLNVGHISLVGANHPNLISHLLGPFSRENGHSLLIYSFAPQRPNI